MPGVVRQVDLCSGHDGYPPRPPSSWSNNVTANTLNVVRVSDGWNVHCKDGICHPGSQVGGSPNVTVNNKMVARIGDSISCGSSNAGGSATVKANG